MVLPSFFLSAVFELFGGVSIRDVHLRRRWARKRQRVRVRGDFSTRESTFSICRSSASRRLRFGRCSIVVSSWAARRTTTGQDRVVLETWIGETVRVVSLCQLYCICCQENYSTPLQEPEWRLSSKRSTFMSCVEPAALDPWPIFALLGGRRTYKENVGNKWVILLFQLNSRKKFFHCDFSLLYFRDLLSLFQIRNELNLKYVRVTHTGSRDRMQFGHILASPILSQVATKLNTVPLTEP